MRMTRRKIGVMAASVAVAASNKGTGTMAAVNAEVRAKVEAVVSG